MTSPIEVRTGLYREVHHEEPRGRRTWEFAMGPTTEIYRVPHEDYLEAKDMAVRRAKECGVTYIIVLPY